MPGEAPGPGEARWPRKFDSTAVTAQRPSPDRPDPVTGDLFGSRRWRHPSVVGREQSAVGRAESPEAGARLQAGVVDRDAPRFAPRLQLPLAGAASSEERMGPAIPPCLALIYFTGKIRSAIVSR